MRSADKQLFNLKCPQCGAQFVFGAPTSHAESDSKPAWHCRSCSFKAPGSRNFVSLTRGNQKTAEHYSVQWSEKMGFLAFVQGNPRAKSVMPSAKLGWDRLFAEIRSLASAGTVSVYDAACGFGGIANELVNDTTCHNLRYLGVDIHAQLETILQRIPQLSVCGLLMQHDISSPPPIDERFDYVLCRASLHHTPHPPQSFAALCSMLKPGGKIAVSLYRKKGPCREAIDDALRAVVSGMSSDEAFDVCRQFTEFGKALQAVQEKVSVPQDLPLLGINKGEYGVHELFYWYFLKCFYNNEFGDKYSTLVNFDWYHPPFAYRYTREEVESWFEQNRIRVIETQSIDAQHYLFGEKHPEQSGRSC